VLCILLFRISGSLFSSLFFLIFVPLSYVFLENQKKQIKLARMESELPNLLLDIALLPQNPYKIMDFIAKSNYLLSEYFAIIKKRMSLGEPLEESIKIVDAPQRVKDFLQLYLSHYKNGGDFSHIYREFAKNILEEKRLNNDINAIFSFQKYTLFGSIALFLPILFKLNLSIAGDLGFKIPGTIKVDLSFFIIIVSALISGFVSLFEKKKENFFPYFVSLTICSLFLLSI